MDMDEQYDRLLRYCFMKVRNRSLAEDITQETYARFFANGTYKDSGRETAYLYIIARNLCTDYFRKRKELSLDALPPEKQAAVDSGDETCRLLDHMSVEQALDRLTAEEREIIVLRYVSDLTVTDIARMMKLSRFAVHRRLNAAMKKMKREMEG